MNKALFEEYNELETSIRILKEQQNGVREKLIMELVTEDVAKVQTDFGTFSRIPKKTYEFEEDVIKKVTSLKKQIKKEEALAKAEGRVSVEVIQTLRFTPNKLTEI